MESVLVIGSGGREHAIAHKLSESREVTTVYVIPGNPGMLTTDKIKIHTLDINKIESLINFVKENSINLTFVGPEGPLANGIVDIFQKHNLLILGPTKSASKLESSKIFSKEFMKEFSIPTAKFKAYESCNDAINDLDYWSEETGLVIKSDELAAGKGVVVTHKKSEAMETIKNFMDNPDYPVSTKKLLIEEKVRGTELSVFALCDGQNYKVIGHATDHKRLLDNDEGPNTGGMGCIYNPTWPTKDLLNKIENVVIKPTLNGMQKRKNPYKGILFIGLMVEKENINVLEYNIRLGDPETQCLLPIVETDLYKAFKYAAMEKLNQLENFSLKDTYSIHIVKSSAGYPGLDGKPMDLNNKIVSNGSFNYKNEFLFFAGVKKENDLLVNSGGRVLGVTSLNETKEGAISDAYRLADIVRFRGEHFRKDIGKN